MGKGVILKGSARAQLVRHKIIARETKFLTWLYSS